MQCVANYAGQDGSVRAATFTAPTLSTTAAGTNDTPLNWDVAVIPKSFIRRYP